MVRIYWDEYYGDDGDDYEDDEYGLKYLSYLMKNRSYNNIFENIIECIDVDPNKPESNHQFSSYVTFLNGERDGFCGIYLDKEKEWDDIVFMLIDGDDMCHEESDEILEIPELPPNLKMLSITNINLGKLPPLPDGLISLSCRFVNFDIVESLPDSLLYLTLAYDVPLKLTKYPKNIKYMDICINNDEPMLPLPDSLEYLSIRDYPYDIILPKNLIGLHLARHKYNYLPEFPPTLEILDLSFNNKLTLPESLIDTILYKNIIERKPSDNYYSFDIRHTPIWKFAKEMKEKYNINFIVEIPFIKTNSYISFIPPPETYDVLNLEIYFKYKKAVNIISDWFLDCKYNPKYKYCRKNLEIEFADLQKNQGNNQILE